MDAIYVQIIDGLYEVFPDAQGIELTAASVLGELPDWDSMAAVNLQSYLQQHFDIEVPLELLADETSLEEVAAYLKNPVNSESV